MSHDDRCSFCLSPESGRCFRQAHAYHITALCEECYVVLLEVPKDWDLFIALLKAAQNMISGVDNYTTISSVYVRPSCIPVHTAPIPFVHEFGQDSLIGTI